MSNSWTRREFINRGAGSAAVWALAPRAGNAVAQGAGRPALKGRFLTHVSLVRVNQIEVTPTRSIGQDESADKSPAQIRSRREAFLAAAPMAK